MCDDANHIHNHSQISPTLNIIISTSRNTGGSCMNTVNTVVDILTHTNHDPNNFSPLHLLILSSKSCNNTNQTHYLSFFLYTTPFCVVWLLTISANQRTSSSTRVCTLVKFLDDFVPCCKVSKNIYQSKCGSREQVKIEKAIYLPRVTLTIIALLPPTT